MAVGSFYGVDTANPQATWVQVTNYATGTMPLSQWSYWSPYNEPRLWTQAVYADVPRALLDGAALARVQSRTRWLLPEPRALGHRRHRLTIAPRACAAARQPSSARVRYRRTMRRRPTRAMILHTVLRDFPRP